MELAATPDRSPNFSRFMLGIMVILMVIISMTGWNFLQHQQARLRLNVKDGLAAIADLKVQEIVQWRNERLNDARFFFQAAFVARDVQAFLADPSSEATKADLLHWLTLLKGGKRYNRVALFDPQLKLRLTIPPQSATPDPPIDSHRVAAALRSRDVTLTDLHRDAAGQHIHFSILFPVFPPRAQPADPGEPLGVIVLQIDPRQFLYPLIQTWPTPSQTAETLLVRREGEDVLFLNELRHRSNTALELRVPIARPDLPAALAIRGYEGMVEGRDYRNVPVLAAVRAVPDSSWFLVAKVDQEEIYAPLRQQAATTGLIIAVLMLTASLGMGFLWRQRDAQWLRRQLAVERERYSMAQRVEHLLKNANDIIILADSDAHILEANEYALKSYGYSLDELRGLNLVDLRAPEERDSLTPHLVRLLREGSVLFETLHCRKDGSTFPVEISSRAVEIGGVAYLLGIIRDISQRKAHEREIERLNRLYAALSQVNQTVVWATTRQGLFDELCRVLVEFGRFSMAWIGCHDPHTHAVVPAAQYGDKLAYLNEIQIFADDRPEGRGPVGVAIREGRSYICNDFFDDPTTLPWRESARRQGFRAAAALPVRLGGKVCGALTLYASEPGFFGQREIALLEEAALDISFGLDRLEEAAQRRKAEDERDRLFDMSPDLIGVAGFDGYFKQINPAFTRLLGWETRELLTQPWLDFVHPDDLATTIRVGEDLTRGQAVRDFENRYRCQDGAYRWLSWNTYPSPDLQQVFFVARDVTERKEAEARIEHLAYYDALTDLPNRILLRDRATQALANAHRENAELALLFLDLDHFKTINDSLGHSVGDQLLRMVADRLRQAVRDTDTVSRLGGDEFLVMLVETGAQGVARVARKILELFQHPFELDARILHVATSIGISVYPRDAQDFESLLRYADAALYRAKEDGRNTFHFFQPDMDIAAFERLMLESALRQALVRGEFELHYQPQVDLGDSRLVGFEALIRWRHPELGMMSPAKFIPVAESSGLIIEIGAWVLSEACRQNQAWREAGLFQVPMAVNLSAIQIYHGNLVPTVRQILIETGLPPAGLELEVTESHLVEKTEIVLDHFRQLKALGVKFAIDDFGTGYSSLSYLKRFPIDKLKIDQSFVRDIVEDPDDLSIAHAVVSMGHSLRLTVIAEGVENQEVAQLLRDMACDEAQGYFFARPMPAAQVPEWLASRRVTTGS